ncbi:MAG: class I SAM-dependent methyltransferase [Candidatus Eremiobacterota bacterium]
MSPFPDLFQAALRRRENLLAALESEGTDAVRLFHGVAEGWPGLVVDRFGPLVLVQTFREPLAGAERLTVERELCRTLNPDSLAVVHRGERRREEDPPVVCREFGRSFLVRARHRGLDPYLFLDLRCGRRWLARFREGSLLNLFAYTCSAGVHAACNGMQVLNVDFSQRHLDLGEENARLNGVNCENLCEDAIPVLRQLSGLGLKGRSARRRYARLEPRQYDLVFLDPPTRAVSPFGAVDILRDYPSLLKPALLCTRAGGWLLATHHSAEVPLSDWMAQVRRTAEKSSVTLDDWEVLRPEADFPSPDGEPPLKVLAVRVARF